MNSKLAFSIALFSVLLVSTFAYKEKALKGNKTPKEAFVSTTVCDECETLVKRFAEAAKDPAKMTELKQLLGLLCHETSYEDECREFVSHLDLFIEKLLPYLKDAHAVCAKFHLCSNAKLDQFHRVGLLFAKKYLTKVDGAHDLICEECQFAVHELAEVIDNRQTQKDIQTFISDHICVKLGKYRASCDIVVQDFLPDIFAELHDVLQDPKRFCMDMKLCTARQVNLPLVSREYSDEVKVSKRIIHGLLH